MKTAQPLQKQPWYVAYRICLIWGVVAFFGPSTFRWLQSRYPLLQDDGPINWYNLLFVAICAVAIASVDRLIGRALAKASAKPGRE